MNTSSKLTLEQKLLIPQLRAQGLSFRRIGKIFKLTGSGVLRIVEKYNASLTKRKITAAEAKIMYRDDYTCQICLHPGLNVSKIGSTRENKAPRCLCDRCLKNVELLVKMGYLK